MTLIKRNYKTLDNLFDEMLNGSATWGRDNNVSLPAVNIFENTEAYVLELVAPGLQKEDFKITLDKGLLTISFEKPNMGNNTGDVKTLKKEFTVSSFKRSFSIDEKINTEAIEAKYDSGLLKLHLPKKEELKLSPRQIAIQ